jgi:hypothetical protein
VKDFDRPAILDSDPERAREIMRRADERDEWRQTNEHMRENFRRGLAAQQDLAAARMMIFGLAVAAAGVAIVLIALIAGALSR